jgi:hypothetical protein
MPTKQVALEKPSEGLQPDQSPLSGHEIWLNMLAAVGALEPLSLLTKHLRDRLIRHVVAVEFSAPRCLGGDR